MDKENSPKTGGKAKLLVTTGIICAMGGYICGDKVDELDKLAQERQPYEIADSLLQDAASKQAKWLEIQEQLRSKITSYRITIDSLERVIGQQENCLSALENTNSELKQCEEASESLRKGKDESLIAYKNEQSEVTIRDNQIDSLENLAKSYRKENLKLQEEYRDRSPVENEFEAIHNCINAQGHSMYPYEFKEQVKCCIKTLKTLQRKYPKDKFENIRIKCNAD